MPQSLKTTLDFLLDVRFNNNKTWFSENRSRYDASQRAVEGFLTDLFPRFGPVLDLGTTKPKDCLFRIFRDVRFSKDKTPYKTQVGMVIGSGGRKAEGLWYYVHLEPDDSSFVATGLYEPTPEHLRAVREAIAADDKPLRKILNAKAFKKWTGGLEGETLKVPPRGYPADHTAIDLLKHKQLLATHRLSDADVLADDFAAHVIEACLAMKPFAEYLDALR